MSGNSREVGAEEGKNENESADYDSESESEAHFDDGIRHKFPSNPNTKTDGEDEFWIQKSNYSKGNGVNVPSSLMGLDFDGTSPEGRGKSKPEYEETKEFSSNEGNDETSNKSVASICEYFESQITPRKDSSRPSWHKRSQLTRKRSKSLTALHAASTVGEQAKLQGDSIEQDLISRMVEEKDEKAEKEKPVRPDVVSNILFQLIDYTKRPQNISNTKPEMETLVYTVDKVLYNHKISASPSENKVWPQNISSDNIPRQALYCEDGNALKSPWLDTKAADVLNYVRNTAVDLASGNPERYVSREESRISINQNSKSAFEVFTTASIHNVTTEAPRKPNTSSLKSEHKTFCNQNQVWRNPSTAVFTSYTLDAGNQTDPSKQNSQMNLNQEVGMDSTSRTWNRFPLMTQQQPNTSTNSVASDVNNNAYTLPTPSSSDDTFLESFRLSRLDSPHQGSSRREMQTRGVASSFLTHPSPHGRSSFSGNVYDCNIRDTDEDERARTVKFTKSQHNGTSAERELTKKSKLIDDAKYAVQSLLRDLTDLWGSVSEKGSVPVASLSSKGLIELVGLCTYVVKEMENDWNSLAAFYPNRQKLDELTYTNRLLRDRLNETTSNQSQLQTELVYLKKEKEMVAQEVKELAMQLAEAKQNARSREAAQHRRSGSNSSLGFKISLDPDAGTKLIKKREDDFNSLMDVVRTRENDITFYHSQFEQYNNEVEALQKQIETTKEKQVQLEKTHASLVEEHKAISRERNHYESILKLILQERQSDGLNLHDLLQTLISKLNTMAEEAGGEIKGGLLEGALQAVQVQNANYRTEIQRLKDILSQVSKDCLGGKCQQEATRTSDENYSHMLEEKKNELKEVQKLHQEKFGHLQEIHDLVCQSKAKLDKAYAEKSKELKKVKEDFTALEKASMRQQRKIQVLQKLNMSLNSNVKELQDNVDSLNSTIDQLRTALSEKNKEINDRARHAAEEVSQLKEHCKWFQSQIDHLTQQLADAQDRMKGHERDKACLASQVMNAEEERKVVDRKLQELRAALQGDSVLREALLQRNEALQGEINRLRRAKFTSLEMSMNKGNEELSCCDPPPAEMSTTDAMVGFQGLTLNTIEKHGTKKNWYTASTGYEEPRAVASMHSTSERSK